MAMTVQVEIDIGSKLEAVMFSPNGGHLVSGGEDGVQVWRVDDGELVATMEASGVQCLSMSKDGRWIGAGTRWHAMAVWDAKTYEAVLTVESPRPISGIDFAPNTARLVVASRSASVWDIGTRQRVLRLHHEDWLRATKYSPQGDRIATATENSIRVYDSNNGRLLSAIPVKATLYYNSGLTWFDNWHLFVVSDKKIKQIDASTGSTIFEWPVALGWRSLSVALPKHGEFIAYSAGRTVIFWDMSTRTQLGYTEHDQDIYSIALSPDNHFLAVGEEHGKIIIQNPSRIVDSIPPSRLYPTFQEPDVQIDDIVVDAWRHDKFANAQELLTAALFTSRHASHHVLATRALVRAHLQHWDAAIEDAKESIKIQPSVIGYIAKSVSLVGKGEKHRAYRTCDIAFEHFHSTHVSFLLLIKAIIVFMAGEHDDAIFRMDDLIDTVRVNPIYYMIQAYMYLLLGNSRMESGDHKGAIPLFEHALARMRHPATSMLSLISLITGWKLDGLSITVRQRLCEALYAAGHGKQAYEYFIKMTHLFNETLYTNISITHWVSDFTQRCLATPQSSDAVFELSPLLNEWAKAVLMNSSWTDALTASVGIAAPRFTIYRAVCERLEMVGRILDASKCFLQMVNEFEGQTDTLDAEARWVLDFRLRCSEKLERVGDAAAEAQQHDDAISYYSVAVSLHPDIPEDLFVKRSKARMAKGLWKDALDDAKQPIKLNPSSLWGFENILTEWAKVSLEKGLWKGAVSAARDFDVPMPTVYRALCEGLEALGGIMDAIECFHQMLSDMTEETIMRGEQAEWICEFRIRCSEKLGHLGDAAIDNQRREEAIGHYSTALSIHPVDTQGFYILRSKVCIAKELWEEALDSAEEAITFDPLSPWGYEAKHAALHKAGRYGDAIQTFEKMLSKMDQSSDPTIRDRRSQYINPSKTRALIRKVIQRTIRRSPRVLIHTTTGYLCNKSEQTSAFMSVPIFNELVSSMTTHIDRSRIKYEVRQFFRYVMLSHKWEENEPLFEQIIHMTVYDLDQSPTHDKLQMFCKITQDAGFYWAWSDTCCIDKQNHFVLQEALVAMFRWYRRSALMIVFLRGVHSPAEFGDLMRSIWNTRGWTLQEYVAAKVIRFYTEDWTPYLNLDTFNHKESPEIISEMEIATSISAQQLTALQPGLGSIREKLRLASTRKTTLVEDAAYSLLGIFSVAGIPPIYGEGDDALGRLLAHILAGSGDASILAWTGQSGSYNSCLPAHITVFNRPATSHLPSLVENSEMEKITNMLHASPLDLDVAVKLYNRLSELPAPWFAASRMKLPCLAFKLPPFSPFRTSSGRVYRAETPAFGMVEIKTRQDPSRFNSLYLIHPWLDALLDREDMQAGAFMDSEDDIVGRFSPGIDDEDVSDEEIEDDVSPLPEPRSPSPPVRVDVAPIDRDTLALRLIARLRQPFGALLLTLTPTRRRSVVYRRVAADSPITLQLQESIPLTELLDNVRILDVL